MLQTLFYIPARDPVFDIPVFGFGWALAGWAVLSVVILLYNVRRQGWNADTLGYLPLLIIMGLAIVYLAPNLLDSNGRGLPIRGFGVMMLLGVVSGVGMSVHRARSMGVDPEVIFSLAFFMFLFGIAGARLFYVIEYPEKFRSDTVIGTLQAVLNVPEGGIVLYGAFLGGAAAALGFCYVRKLPTLALFDIIAPGMVVGAAFGRVGCFLNGCCFAGLCATANLPQVEFPENSPPYQFQLANGWLHGMALGGEGEEVVVREVFSGQQAEAAGVRVGDKVRAINGLQIGKLEVAQQALLASSSPTTIVVERGAASPKSSQFTATIPISASRSLPVHPVQLYDAINLSLMALMLWRYYPLRRRDGEVIAILLAVYPITRFIIEEIRVDEPGQLGTAFSISQLISFGIFAAAVALFTKIELQRRPPALPWRGIPVTSSGKLQSARGYE